MSYQFLLVSRYLSKNGKPLGHKRVDHSKVQEWLEKIDSWDSKLFTLNQCPNDHAIHFISKFKRQVVITRLVENPDARNVKRSGGLGFKHE